MKSIGRFPDRQRAIVAGLFGGIFFVAMLTLVLGHSHAAVMLLDRETHLLYPFTIQNLMHLIFFVGLAEAYVRWRVSWVERRFLGMGFLPEDDETVLQAGDLGAIRQKVKDLHDGENGFLPSLIDLCILQFQASRSVDQTVNVLNSSLELINHRVDLRYAALRYIVWVIPTIGFIGTVVGIAVSLTLVNPDNPDLERLTESLGVAFYTTLLALAQSAVLMLLVTIVQSREEHSLNSAGQYTLRNLINRLYAGR